MDPILGMISMFGFNFAPKYWATCDGQVLSIAQNTALFSLLGTTFGGNGQTTFQLPDLRGRVPIHQGQGPGLSNYSMGQAGGVEMVTLNIAEMPAHSHNLHANGAAGDTGSPINAIFANSGATDREYLASGQANVNMSASAISSAGGSQPHENRQPYLVVNYCIAIYGIYPSRS